MSNLLGTGIAKYPHLNVFDQIAEERFAALDLNPVFMYLIDTVPASALYALADQLGVLGYGGWKLATTEEQQRELIRTAIALQAYKGTPYGIKQAVKAIGFFDAAITEGGTTHLYDGTYFYDGTITYSSLLPLWPLFSVEFDLGNYVGVTEDQVVDIIALILEYKNERSWLTEVRFRSTFQEDQYVTDRITFTIEFSDFIERVETAHFYNGVYFYDGTINYDNPHETFEFVVI